MPKGMEVILFGELNVTLRKPRDDREENLVSALAGSRLGNVIDHFTPRWRYIGTGSWMWKMRVEGR